jgi:predicted nucleic acid-binding protein
MIILDTNVLSALMRDQPDPAVITWLDKQPAESIWTTAITVLEVRTGLELLRASRRRTQLESAFDGLLRDDLDGRVLSFDTAAANAAGVAVAAAQRRGKSAEIRDCQIAGIALARRATLATRNGRHFQPLGVTVVDPWDEG